MGGQGESYTQPNEICEHQILVNYIELFPSPFLLAFSTMDYRLTAKLTHKREANKQHRETKEKGETVM